MIGRLRVAGIRIGMVLAMTATAVVGPGCNNGDFVPPPPPDQRVQTGGGSRARRPAPRRRPTRWAGEALSGASR